MKHKTSELEGELLDEAVEKAEQYVHRPGDPLHHYSSAWAIGGPLIERENITLLRLAHPVMEGMWMGVPDKHHRPHANRRAGPTPLIAAMRAYVASKFGEEVDLP